jgi:sugar/nucleoside kinase (ribokinase family)
VVEQQSHNYNVEHLIIIQVTFNEYDCVYRLVFNCCFFNEAFCSSRSSLGNITPSTLQKYKMIIAACGGCCLDIYSIMKQFPTPNTKQRVDSSHVEVGGNATNVLTVLSHLIDGTHSIETNDKQIRLLTMIGKDLFANQIQSMLNTIKMDCSHIVYNGNTTTPFSQILVTGENHSERTIIHCAASEELNSSSNVNAELFLNDVGVLFLDGRQLRAAEQLVNYVDYSKTIVYLELERIREIQLLDLIKYANFVTCSESFIDEYLNRLNIDEQCDRIGRVLSEIYNQMKLIDQSFVVVTIGSRGSLLLTKKHIQNMKQINTYATVSEFLEQTVDSAFVTECHLTTENNGTYVLYHCPAYKNLEVKDTTGAGDSFNASILYSLHYNSSWSIPQTLQFASIVSANICSEIGIRDGLNKIYTDQIVHSMSQ